MIGGTRSDLYEVDLPEGIYADEYDSDGYLTLFAHAEEIAEGEVPSAMHPLLHPLRVTKGGE